MGTGLHLKQFPGAFKVHFVTVDHPFQRIRRGAGLIGSENRPDRWVFRTEPPQSETGRMITAGGAHLVECRDAVEEPDNVMLLILFVVVVVWIACFGIEIDLRLRISGVDQRLLKTNFLRLRSFRPVVTVIPEGDDRLCRIQLTHPF